MLRSKTAIKIGSKPLLLDLVSRDGSPTAESPSPYNGAATHIYNQFEMRCRSYGITFEGSLTGLFAGIKDYDLDEQCPIKDEEYFDWSTTGTVKPHRYLPSEDRAPEYARRLEDVDYSWVEKYLDNVLNFVVRADKNSARSYSYSHQQARFMYDEEDGDYVPESELLTDGADDYSINDYIVAKEKAPYLMRRLHDKSKQMRVSIMSLVIAAEKAKVLLDKANRQKNYKSSLSPKDLLAQGVYMMNQDGTLGPMFSSDANNGNKRFAEAKDWILTVSGRDKYYEDMVELLHYFEVLGIDIKEEDPHDFQEDFIASLTVTYLASNKEYISRKRSGFHKGVFEELKKMPLEMMIYSSQLEDIDMLAVMDNTMNIFNYSTSLPQEINDRLKSATKQQAQEIEDNLILFIVLYNQYYRKNINPTGMITRDGFYYLNIDTPLCVDISGIYRESQRDSFTPTFYEALIHEAGYLVILSDGHYTAILELTKACEYIRQRNNPGTGFGKWLEVCI